MKISCLPLSFMDDILNKKMSIRKWAETGKDLGLDAIDLSILFLENHSPVYLKRIRKDLEAENIEVLMITTYPDFTNPDTTQRHRELEYLRHDIAIASNIGAKYLRVLAGQAHPETEIEEGINWAVDNFSKASDIARNYNVQLLYENHAKPGAWDYVDFSHPTKIFLKIVEGIKNTDIKINFDTANTLAYGDDPMTVLKEVIGNVETIHAADTSTRGCLNHTLLGTGLVDFKEIFRYLKSKGFDGWISIEENSQMGGEGVKKSIDFVKQNWEKA